MSVRGTGGAKIIECGYRQRQKEKEDGIEVRIECRIEGRERLLSEKKRKYTNSGAAPTSSRIIDRKPL